VNNNKRARAAHEERSMIIAFHNFKGGVGTTTLAAHTCALARDCGIDVVGVSIDVEQELPRWLERAQIGCIELDLQHGHTEADLIVLDVQSHSAPPLNPDVWIVPICDGSSNRIAGEVSDRLRGHLIWLGNKGHTPIVPAFLADDVELASPMPYSRALAQTAGRRDVLWNVPDLADSAGAWALRASLLAVLRRAYLAVHETLPPGLLPRTMKALTAGEVLSMVEPPSPFMRTFTALIEQVQAQLHNQPFEVAPKIASGLSLMAYKTVDAWFGSLHHAGLELANGQTSPQALARSLGVDVAHAARSRLGAGTVQRFIEQPDRARVSTLVRLAVASGRTHLLELRPRTAIAQDLGETPNSVH
jgi:hypothetical protein